MDKIQTFRQFISPFIQGRNANALIATLAEQAQKLEDLSIAVTDQLTISTASEEYLEKRLSEIGIVIPYDLGISDDALRAIGIKTTAIKQTTSIIHDILEVFYGPENVRAFIDSTKYEPFVLKAGMSLDLLFDNNQVISIPFYENDFVNITAATAQEIANVITRTVQSYNIPAYAIPYTEHTTQNTYVRIYSATRGPYSLVQVLGGEAQNKLEFPSIRNTDLGNNNTVWEITRTYGNTLRFRWNGGGNAPLLDKVKVGDKVLIYGQQFINPNGASSVDLRGTFEVTAVRLPQANAQYNSGWFEIENANNGLRSSKPDEAPPPNNPPNYYYSYTIAQAYFDDLKFFKPYNATAYNKLKYALAFEPAKDQLHVYLPITTSVIYRNLTSAAHLHAKYPETELNGSFGSDGQNNEDKIEIINDYIIRYKHPLLDVKSYGGKLSWEDEFHVIHTVDIQYIYRENGYVTVITTQPHGIYGTIEWRNNIQYTQGQQVWHIGYLWEALNDNQNSEPAINNTNWKQLNVAKNYSDIIITINTTCPADDIISYFGPYLWDTTAPYTLSNVTATTRNVIYASEKQSILLTNGVISPSSGALWLDLGYDCQEGPIPYYGVQLQQEVIPVEIDSFVQNGYLITIRTKTPHGAIINDKIKISGTNMIDGIYTVYSVSNIYVYMVQSTIYQNIIGTGGTSTVLLTEPISTVLLDTSYTFKHNHAINASVSVLSSSLPYQSPLDGSDYSFFVTGVVEATKWCKKIIQDITAAGINLEITLIYPSDIGLGHAGGSTNIEKPPVSDKIWVWGT